MELGPRVPAIGPGDAKIVLVGESPGKQEARVGAPFVGPAGAELDRFLRAAGLRRDDIYITNVVKYLPQWEKNKDEFFFHTELKPGTKTIVLGRTPTKVYIDGIVELVGELQAVKPNVVVPLGNYALWALTQQTGILKYRGSILESKLIPKLKVIPTIHPAHYLYQDAEYGAMPEKRLLGNWDFIRIAEQSRFPDIVRPKRDFITNPSPFEIEEAIERYTDSSLEYLGVDTEWYSPDSLAYIAFGVGTERVVCITPDSMLAFRAYKAILGSPVPKVWQNAMFDAAALYRMGIKVENVAHDTMLEWFLNWGTVVGQKGLDVICSVLTEQPYYKDDVEFVGQDDRGREYCCTDVAVMNEAHEKMQAEEFALTGTKKGYEISMSIMNTMIHAAQTGILVDLDKLERMRAEKLEAAAERNKALCEKLGIPKLNVRSWQQVQRIVYDELGFGKRFTERSTDQKVLMDIAATLYAENPKDEGVAILIEIIRERQDLNICSRYITPKIVDSDGRTKTNWNLAGTKNGRLSSTIPWWNGVAIQTMPEEGRELLISDPSHVFVGWDLAQAEARVVAVLARDYDLLEDMARGVDIHIKLASMLPFGMSYEEILAEVMAGVREGKSKDENAKRFLAKRTRHASNYIQSWRGLQQQINKDFLDTMIGVNAAVAKMLSEGFLAASPGLEGWWQETLSLQNEQGYLLNDFGRRRNWHSRVKRYDHEHKDGVAFRPQSDISDLTTLSIAEIDKTEWITPLAHMHDGGLLQVPVEMKDDAIALVQRTMTREFRVEKELLTVPVDVKVGFDWKNMSYVK